MASQFIAALVQLIITGFFCYTITKVFSHVSPHNWTIQPRYIWLLMIPGLNWIWNFVVAFKLSSTLKNELEERDFDLNNRPTFVQGMFYAVISLLSVIPSIWIFMSATTTEEILKVASTMPEGFALAIQIVGIVQVIAFITYWSKISWYKKVLENDEGQGNEDN